jgi:ribosome biogenesis GTPase / thiamine phosphate phosphatase
MTVKHHATVLSRFSNQFIVSQDGTRYHCVLKGLHKKAGRQVLVGDHVELDNIDPRNGTARIAHIWPRRNELDRPQVANVTTLLVMSAVNDPPYDTGQLDRYITLGLLSGLEVHLGLTKMDLLHPGQELQIQELTERYQAIGVRLWPMCTHEKSTLHSVMAAMLGKTVVLAGPSGVGKSSFLNALQPGLALKVGDVSEKLGRGTHTTRNETLIEMPVPGTNTEEPIWWVDTPGFSHLNLDRVAPRELLRAFPEFETLSCHYPDCLHEPQDNTQSPLTPQAHCGLSTSPNTIHPERYEHYLAFLSEAKAFEARQRQSTQKARYGSKTVDGLEIIKLKQAQRAPSRRVQKQQNWGDEAHAEIRLDGTDSLETEDTETL